MIFCIKFQSFSLFVKFFCLRASFLYQLVLFVSFVLIIHHEDYLVARKDQTKLKVPPHTQSHMMPFSFQTFLTCEVNL